MTPDPAILSGQVSESGPDLTSLRALTVPIIIRHARAGCWLCVVALMLYAVADFHVNRSLLLPLYGLAVAQFLALGAGLLVLNRVRTWRAAVTTALLAFATVLGLGVVSDWISANMQSTALTALAASVITAALIPWGLWGQLGMAVVCGLTSGSAVLLIRGSLEGLDHAVVAAIILLGGSVYAAHAAERSRLSTLRAQRALDAERELRRSFEKEKEVAELKSRFVSMASHEFRTPLAAILAAADALGRYVDRMTPDDRQARVAKIEAQVKHMTRLLDGVLTLGKAEAGVLRFVPERVDLAALCQDLIAEVQAASGTTHRLVLTTAGSLDQVVVDPRLVRQILDNLLSNAVKYSPGGGTVECALARNHDTVSLRVSDQGIGIPPEDQRHLFETFHRGANVGKVPGTGLGLAIAKKAVELHGGTIAVQSAVDVGTTITVTLREPHQRPVGARRRTGQDVPAQVPFNGAGNDVT